jgi:hydrogenase maturation protein HypF
LNILLKSSGACVLACGAWLKNTVCVTDGNQARISALIGDLDSVDARLKLDEAVSLLCENLPVELVVHDLHPDFYSTQFALDFAAQRGLPTLSVQHHHAHIAAICAEHHIDEPVLALALDGVGLGTDNTPWGGELLCVSGADFQRLGHLAYLPMPGGDRAAQEPWRMAAAALFILGRGDEISTRFCKQAGAATVAAMLQRSLNCPATSSMGRLFDAAAGLLGVSEIQTFEAQAAIALQTLAQQHGLVTPMQDGWHILENGVLDFAPLLRMLADCREAAYCAALFHATIAAGLADWVLRAAGAQSISRIALGGGCFHNGILLSALTDHLKKSGLQVLTAQLMQPNDSAISLGQAWVGIKLINSNTFNKI